MCLTRKLKSYWPEPHGRTKPALDRDDGNISAAFSNITDLEKSQYTKRGNPKYRGANFCSDECWVLTKQQAMTKKKMENVNSNTFGVFWKNFIPDQETGDMLLNNNAQGQKRVAVNRRWRNRRGKIRRKSNRRSRKWW
ncbi:hypothetical protein C5167_001244 [Papaver somniferum]|uniref:Uncharacterized protein n=1 Tax=Papaver somniferum TaxID=3469 RepID=A0A4Y7KXN1_PAPSO|nr:hypothetical protein C5167_001244 [Papaver somniferum]